MIFLLLFLGNLFRAPSGPLPMSKSGKNRVILCSGMAFGQVQGIDYFSSIYQGSELERHNAPESLRN